MGTKVKVVAGIVAGLFVLGLIAGRQKPDLLHDDDARPSLSAAAVETAPASSSPAPAVRKIAVTGDAAVVRVLAPACRSEDAVKSLLKMMLAGDGEAYAKALLARGLQGECTVLPKGEAVFVTELAVWSGLARVRKKGDIDELWTDHGFIDKAE